MTTIPTTHAELKHSWWVEDFTFQLSIMQDFHVMIKKHPDLDDPTGNCLRDMYKRLEWELGQRQRQYKKRYGRRMNLNKLKKEIWD